MRAVGCHVYTGGFSAGVAKHFDVIAHLETTSEIRKYQKEAYGLLAQRFPDSRLHIGAESWPALPDVDLLYGNPPCSLWSRLGKKDNPGPRLACLQEFLHAVRLVKPKVAAFETLPKFMEHPIAAQALGILREQYAEVSLVYHDVKFLGLAQARPRLFIAASDYKLDFPRPHHNPVYVGEVLDSVPDPGFFEPTPDEWLLPWAMGGRISKNFRAIHGTDVAGLKRPSFARRRLERDRVSYCLTKAIYMYHPDLPRVLGTNEVCALMGYPPDWTWPRSARQWMCKGVTPNAGEYLARCVRDSLDAPARAHAGILAYNHSSPTGRRDDRRVGDQV